MRLGALCFCLQPVVLLLILCAGCAVPEAPEEEGERGQVFQPIPPVSTGRVVWRAWARRDSARRADLPLFLFLSSRRSVWCRDMAVRCFEDPELASEIGQGTFPVWVDVDQRPDLAERYGMGGWPSVVFLMPDGAWITGATYLDPVDLLDLLRRVRIYFDNPERREDLERERGYLEDRIARESRLNPPRFLAPSRALLDRVADRIGVALGRGETPSPEALVGLFEYAARTGKETARAPAVRFLEALATGSLRDEDGVFFLAALTPDGAVVDQEKALAYNAGLLAALSRAAPYSNVCREAAETLGERLAEAFVEDSLFVAGFDGNGARDSSVYTGWNALAVSGFTALFQVNQNRRYLDLARTVFQVMQHRLRLPEGGFIHGICGADVPLLLVDQALVARAALDLYGVEARPEDLLLARELAGLMEARFRDNSGALCDRVPEPGLAVFPAVDRLSPSGNGVAAQVFFRLAGQAGGEIYRDVAGGILKTLVGPHTNRMVYAGALFRGLVLFE